LALPFDTRHIPAYPQTYILICEGRQNGKKAKIIPYVMI